MRFILLFICLCSFSFMATAQDHGYITFQGKTIKLTGYRTRVSNGKRSVIADAKQDGKLYSVTITLKPDVQSKSDITTDATHSVTITISKEDYSDAMNFCYDGGGVIQVNPIGSNFAVSGKNLPAGNCFGKKGEGDKLSFEIKP